METLKAEWPITVIAPDGKAEWSYGAYTVAFVYSSRGNFIVKGYLREVKAELEKESEKGTKWFANFSLWHQGQHRDIWDFWKAKVGILSPSVEKRRGKIRVRRNKWEFYEYSGFNEPSKKSIKLRRLPKRWIKEMEIF